MGSGKRVLVLEPTRVLVEQTYEFYRKYAEVSVGAFHGGMEKKARREQALKYPVVITTPEAALFSSLFSFDAVIVDECHHAVGDDPLKKFLEKFEGEYRLGLSAHIPLRHRRLIEQLIGKIFAWDWSHPDVRPYVAQWVADVYEAPFNEAEREFYKELDARMILAEGREKILYRLALTFFSRDGALALRESARKETKLGAILREFRKKIEELRLLHKWEALERILNEHDFDRAIIFVDRVVVAREIARRLGAALLVGKSGRLEEIREARIIVSTSAGEEGLDLPTADLLVVWSNTSSPLRLVQRRGRILRPSGKLPKFLVFIVTPETLDMDAFVHGVYLAHRAGVDVGVLKNLAEEYARKGLGRKILEVLEYPVPEDWIYALAGLTRGATRQLLKILCETGEVVSVFTETGRAYVRADRLETFAKQRPDLFQPENVSLKLVTQGRKKKPPFFLRRVVVREIKDGVEYVYTLPAGFYVKDNKTLSLLLRHWRTPKVFRTWG